MRALPLLSLAACTGDVARTDKSTVPLDGPSDADTDADADTDTDADADADTAAGAHTGGAVGGVVVDGQTADWPAGTWFPTTGGRTGLSWDADDLFVAVEHPDLGAGPLHWVIVTLGPADGTGTTDGITHGTQRPDTGFPATAVLRFKADGSYTSLWSWDGATWSETPSFLGTDGSALAVDAGGHRAELSVPFARLALPSIFDVHVNLLYEGAGSESTYAPTPAASFPDGYDPDYGAWYRFDRGSGAAPDTYAPETRASGGHTGLPDGHTGGPTADTGPAPWRFTPTVDGAAGEWPAETVFTTSAGTETRVGWDGDDLAIAVTHPDVATGTSAHWLLVATGSGGPGAPEAPPVGTQAAGLPFAADRVLRLKLDGSYADLQAWDGAAWVGTPFAGVGASAESGQTLELTVPRAALGLGDTVTLAAWLAYEGAGYESSYAVTPAAAFSEGAYDPDLGTAWSFDLAGPAGPAGAATVP